MVPRAILVAAREVKARRDELHEGVDEEGMPVDAAAAGCGQEIGWHGGREGFVVARRGSGGGFPAHRGEVLGLGGGVFLPIAVPASA